MSEWTIDTLKEHFEDINAERTLRYDDRFAGQETANKIALASLQREADAYKAEADKKNVELNDVRHRFIPREVFDAYKEDQTKRMRAMLGTLIVMGLTIVGLGLTLIGILIK